MYDCLIEKIWFLDLPPPTHTHVDGYLTVPFFLCKTFLKATHIQAALVSPFKQLLKAESPMHAHTCVEHVLTGLIF